MINQWYNRYVVAPTLNVVAGSVLMASLVGCTFSSVDLGFDPQGEIDEATPATANLVIGHFSDRRGEGPKWIGEDLGTLYLPMTILKSVEPVDLVVRDVVQKNAETRGLLSERGADADYQLSGEITRLYAKKSSSLEAHVLINFRLTTQEGGKEVYQKRHNVDIVEAYTARRVDQVVDLLEDALNQAVGEALDAQPFRDQLENEGDV